MFQPKLINRLDIKTLGKARMYIIQVLLEYGSLDTIVEKFKKAGFKLK